MKEQEPRPSDEFLVAPEAEPAFDDLGTLAAQVCAAGAGIIALKGSSGGLWLKSTVGLPQGAGELALRLCDEALAVGGLVVLPDVTQDARYAGIASPPFRFFAGMPLVGPYGHASGVVAVADAAPRRLEPAHEEGLAAVARQVQAQLELRRILIELARAIGERHRFEEAMRESEERYRELVENANDIIYTHDLTEGFTSLNRAGEKITGYSRDDILRMNFAQVVAPEYVELARQMMARKLAGDPPRIYELEILGREGRRIALELNTRLIFKDGKAVAVQGIARDITERRASQTALQQANEKLSAWIQELEQRNRESSVLSEMGDLLQICLTAKEAYKVIGRAAVQLFRQNAGALLILDTTRSVVETKATWGENVLGENSFGPEECWALRRGRLHAVDPAAAGPVCEHLGKEFRGGALCVPMMAQGETLGVLHLQGIASHPASALGVNGTEILQRLATSVAEHVALALANLKLRETLRNQSIRDGLTGLFNRRYLEASLVRELQRAGRKQRPLSLIMLDVDHFKDFNDTHGHQVGDALLRGLGDYIQRYTRSDDIPCRYGGEEFTLILPEASLQIAEARAERLRAEVAQITAKLGEVITDAVTISCGVAAFPQHGTTAEELLRSADRALYRAKNSGRNRVVVAGSAEMSEAAGTA
jgi:diguanylate cyclase (GGDEF)-like protein/PAS domain S-box-containing protein